MDLLSIFITGLFAGGLTCLAMQGGLLATSIAQQEEDALEEESGRTGHTLPLLSFLLARLAAYTLLGLLLGAVGSAIQISLGMRVFLQVAVSLFMIATALNLLHVHPVFRYVLIQPPKFLMRRIRQQSKAKHVFGPALLGGLTVFIPCGATQAMMAYAISTGSAPLGALTLFVFILGTSPLFLLLGLATKKLSGVAATRFNMLAAIALMLLAVYNLNGALALSGSTWTLEHIFAKKAGEAKVTDIPTQTVNEATIYFLSSGYTTNPKTITVKAGTQVKLNLVNKDVGGCIQAFTIPQLGIQRIVLPGSSTEIVFTAPLISGSLPFMCSMGMFRGVINVI